MSLMRPTALDPSSALDEPLRAALADSAKAGKPTRLSIELKLYRPSQGHYVQWRDLNWKVEFQEIETARRTVEAIDLLLRAMEADAKETLIVLNDIVQIPDDEGEDEEARP